MWMLVCVTLSAMGGWQVLARHYPLLSPFTGRRFRFRSGRLGSVNYGSCLTLGAGTQGLYLAVFPLFRPAHPPLLIPWSEVTVREVQVWLFKQVELEFAKAPSATLRLSPRLAQALYRYRYA
jgi:hypothetical protein